MSTESVVLKEGQTYQAPNGGTVTIEQIDTGVVTADTSWIGTQYYTTRAVQQEIRTGRWVLTNK